MHGHVKSTTQSVQFNGVWYHKREGSKYYWGKGGTQSLHRAIWEDAHGPVPPNHNVHHKDGDPDNNSIDNLECLSVKEHRRHHADHDGPSQKMLSHLESIKEDAAAWHGSRQGRKWHSQHSFRLWSKRKPKTYVCQYCGKDYQSRATASRFCSAYCRNRASPYRLPPRNCDWCGNQYIPNHKGRKYCSHHCAQKGSWRNRKSV